ncbi:MAG: hypothetical protein AB7V19_08180, partial [Candidatus Bipolaricaulia bacterium]
MPERIGTPVDALVIYRRGQTHPNLHAFSWQMRRYDVLQTNLVHAEQEGETTYLIYAVSAGQDHFELRLDTRRGRWTLEERDVGRRPSL